MSSNVRPSGRVPVIRVSTATCPAPSGMKISGTGRSVPAVSSIDSPRNPTIASTPCLDAAEAVVVAVVPGRVGVEHRGEPGHVARGDGLEAGADGVDIGSGAGVGRWCVAWS